MKKERDIALFTEEQWVKTLHKMNTIHMWFRVNWELHCNLYFCNNLSRKKKPTKAVHYHLVPKQTASVMGWQVLPAKLAEKGPCKHPALSPAVCFTGKSNSQAHLTVLWCWGVCKPGKHKVKEDRNNLKLPLKRKCLMCFKPHTILHWSRWGK